MRGCTLLLAILVAGCSPDRGSYDLLVSTEEPASTVAAAMVPLFDKVGMTLAVAEARSPSDVMAAIAAGEADFAIVEEPASMLAGVKTILPLYPSVLHVLHRSAETPADFTELISGHSVYAGPPGSAARRLLADLAGDFDIAGDDFQLLDNPWSVEPDVYFIYGGLLARESVRSLSGYRLFSFGNPMQLGSGTVAEGIALTYPNKRTFVLPEAVYGSLNPEPVLTIATRTVLLGREELRDGAVFEATRILVEHAQELARIYPLVTEELNVNFDPGMLAQPLHPGARRFVYRDEPSFLERNVELIGLVFSALAGLVSGLVWLYRYRQQAKKDRVDVYYRKILDIRASITPDLNAESRRHVVRRIKSVQEEVFSLLIDERVNADETLTIFLDLSNQVLRELGEQPVEA